MPTLFPDGNYQVDLYRVTLVSGGIFGEVPEVSKTPYRTIPGFVKKGDTLTLGELSCSISNNPYFKMTFGPHGELSNGDVVVFSMKTPADMIAAQQAAWDEAQRTK